MSGNASKFLKMKRILTIFILIFLLLQNLNANNWKTIYLSGLKNTTLKQEHICEEATTYVIKGNYEIKDTIVLPYNSILKFEGGSIKNGTLVGNYNHIDAPKYCIFENVNIIGHYCVETVYPEWWGGYPNLGIDCYNAIQSAINFASAYGGNEGRIVQLSSGRYGISSTIVLNPGCKLSGVSPRSTWIYSIKGFINGDWMVDTPFTNNNKPVSATSIENLQIRCTNDIEGEQFDKTCNGVRCRGWNETCEIKNVHINGFDLYGLYLTRNERTITQNSSYRDIFISNSNRIDGRSIGLFLDDVRQCLFESITIDNGPNTKSGIGYGVYSKGHCDLNIFLKLNLEDCMHPIYVKDGIDECSFNALMINNPTHSMEYYSSEHPFATSIFLEECKRGFIINGYKRVNNPGVNYDIVDVKNKKYLTFNPLIYTGNSNIRWFVYEP